MTDLFRNVQSRRATPAALRRLLLFVASLAAAGISLLLTGTSGPLVRMMVPIGLVAVGVGLVALDQHLDLQARRRRLVGRQAYRAAPSGPRAEVSRLWAQGDARRLVGALDEARSVLNQALEASRKVGELPMEGRILISLAEEARQREQIQTAFGHYDQAIDLFQNNKAFQEGGWVLLARASLQVREGDLQAAAVNCEVANQLLIDAGDRLGEANSQLFLADITLVEKGGGDLESTLDQIRFQFSQVNERLGEAHALSAQVFSRFRSTDLQARNLAERALTHYRICGDLLGQAAMQFALANLQRISNRGQDAQRRAVDGADLMRRVCHHIGGTELMSGRGDLRRGYHRFLLVQQGIQELLGLFQETGDLVNEARLLVARGCAEKMMGAKTEARRTLGIARKLGERAENTVIQGDALLGLALLHREQGGTGQSNSLLRQAKVLYQKGDRSTRVYGDLLMDMALIDLLLEKWSQGKGLLVQAQRAFVAEGQPQRAGQCARVFADIDAAMGRVQLSLSAYTQARKLLQAGNDLVGEADVLTILGVLMIGQDRPTGMALLTHAGRVYGHVGIRDLQRRVNAITRAVF